MAKPMKDRAVVKALRREGCTSKPGKGDHEKWYCPCGEHLAVITRGGDISPGVVNDVITKMKCLPKGWLQ